MGFNLGDDEKPIESRNETASGRLDLVTADQSNAHVTPDTAVTNTVELNQSLEMGQSLEVVNSIDIDERVEDDEEDEAA